LIVSLPHTALSQSRPNQVDEEVIPGPVTAEHFAALFDRSPFTRTLFLSESLILSGTAWVDGGPIVTLIDTEEALSLAVSGQTSSRGWRLIELSDDADLETCVATISAEGEVVRVRYDEERIKSATQRMRFASQARAQQAAAKLRNSGDSSGKNHGVPAERVALLQRIDHNELPEGYNPGKGRNREESHQLHQNYVDRRLSGMSERQRGLVGHLWNQKVAVDPGMANRGASFVRIMEHIAENESR